MDREKLIEALDKCYGQPETCGVSSCPYWDLKHPYCECEDRMRKDAIALLKEQNDCENCAIAIEDRQPVVRCKYCNHSTEWYGDKRRCFLWNENGIDVFEDGYCSYGRPKQEGR